MADMKIQGEVSLDTSQADGAFARVETNAGKMAASVKKAGVDAGKGLDGIGAGGDSAASKLDRSTKSIISSIQRTTAAMEAGSQGSSKYYEALAAQRGANVDALKPYLIQLDAAKAKQDAASMSLGNMGMSAKQAAFALRGVPAQFTDIFVSLQSGQAPMTVLLQQGGQLKDMFGGVGNAAKAMGGYILGMVNPFTIAAGVLGAVATAAYQGSKEFEAFNKTLIMNGGTAGVTADQLMSMAAGIDAVNYGISQSKAAETIDEIVKAGVRGETQILKYAKAAAEFERAGGGAATEVAKAFSELGKDPLQASVKLTQSLGYLTEATYLQIKSLEDQGRTVDAARVAQEAYADALENRTPQLLENLGSLQTGWLAIKGAAAEAWGAMLNIGRADTLEDQVAAVEKRLAQARGSFTVGTGGKFDANDPRQASDTALLESLKEQQRLASRSSDMSAERAQKEKERIAFLAQGDKYLSSDQRMQKEILGVQQLRIKGTITEREEEQRIAAIREKNYKKPPAPKKVKDEFGDLYNSLTMKDVGLDPSFYKDLNQLYEGYQKGRISVDEYRDAVENLITTQKFSTDAQKAQSTALAALAKSNNAAFDEEFASIEKRRLSNEAQIRNGREMLEQIQFETSLLGMNSTQREQAIAMRELERAGVIKGTQAYEAYAEAVKKATMDRAAQQETLDFWRDVESTASSVFMDIALNGEDAFKRIGESIKREVIQMLYEMTVKKWIFQIAGISGGTGSSGGLVDMAVKAYDYYTKGSTAGAGAGGGAGAGAAATTAAAAKYGTAAASQQTAMLAAQEAGMATTASTAGATTTAGASTAGSSLMAYAGYAALIVAAVKVAENLYSTGYNRTALGVNSDKAGANNSLGQYTYGRGNMTTGESGGRNWMSNGILALEATNQRRLMDAVGMNEKWADIFSGTTRMATLIGRKLKGFGYEIGIDGANVDVKGYEYYKGGLFRSNKTINSEVNGQDASELRKEIENVRNSAKMMAQAMGLSSESIDNYTGKLRINLKGVKNGEEAAERYNEALQKLQREMLNTVAGLKMSEEEFKAFTENITKNMEAVGISAGGIADIITNGMLGRISKSQVGEQLSDVVIGGIYNAIAGQYAGQIASVFTSQIIQPIFTAIAAGVPISQAISQQAITNVVQTAQQAAATLNAVFADPSFRAAIAGVQQAISGISAAAGSVKAPSYKAAVSNYNEAAEAAKRAAEETKRAWSSVADALTDEIRRIRGELLGDTTQGQSYYMAQFQEATVKARKGDRSAAEMLPELSQAVLDIARSTAGSLADLQYLQSSTIESLTTTRQIISKKFGIKIPAFAEGGDHAGGFRLVGERGAEIEATGAARYFSAEQTSRMLGGGSANAEELRALADAMNRLADSNGHIETNTRQTRELLDRVSQGGDALVTVAA